MKTSKATKLQLYDEIAQKVSYIDSIASLVCAANNADSAANIDAVALCSDLAKDIKELASLMLRAEH